MHFFTLGLEKKVLPLEEKKQAQKKCDQFHFQDKRGLAIASRFSIKPLQLATTQTFPSGVSGGIQR